MLKLKIEIKELARKDHNKAIDFAIKGMNFNRYTENKLGLYLYGRYFLNSELERASQVLAAYTGDRLVGVLMADMKAEPKMNTSFWSKLYVKMVNFAMSLVKVGLDSYDEANKAMFNEYSKNANPDGEICFFAVDPTIQGKGIGTLLLEELGRHEKGKLVYLYTDDNCNYLFYEYKGFERLGEKEIKMGFGKETVSLTCFLYSKQL